MNHFRFEICDFRFVTLVVGALLTLSAVRADEPARATSKTAKSLDKQLLDDLDAGLPEGLDIAKPKPADTKKPFSDIDDKLKQDLGEGEDIGPNKASDPLAKISEAMRAAEALIGKRNTSAKTQSLQREILTDLDALIAKLEKQCQCAGGESKPSKSQSKPSEAKKPGPTNGNSDKESQKPADDSTERIGKNEDAQVEAREMHELVKAVWGNLPPRIRERMQNSSVEQFLPKYEKLIEDYYKRLAEEK